MRFHCFITKLLQCNEVHEYIHELTHTKIDACSVEYRVDVLGCQINKGLLNCSAKLFSY